MNIYIYRVTYFCPGINKNNPEIRNKQYIYIYIYIYVCV